MFFYYGDPSLYGVYNFFTDYPLAVLPIINNCFSLAILYCICHVLQKVNKYFCKSLAYFHFANYIFLEICNLQKGNIC